MPEDKDKPGDKDPGGTPAWLADLQKRSWEPEVFISGIILAFIFLFPAQIYDFSARMVQDYGLDYIGAQLLLMYLAFVVNVFKLFFVVHIALRLAWAGVLGLSYAFPGGVIRENLYKTSRDLDYVKPVDLVLRLERLCSMAFAFPVSIGILMVIMCLYLAALLTFGVLFGLSFFALYLLFVVTLFTVSAFFIFSRKSGLKKRMGRTLYVNIQALYQSNIGKWATVAYLFGIILLAIPFIIEDTRGFSLFFPQSGLTEEQYDWPAGTRYYADESDDSRRFPRVMVPSRFVEGEVLPVFIAWYKADERLVDRLAEGYDAVLDSIGWQKPEAVHDLYRFHVNDSVAVAAHWHTGKRSRSGQRVVTGLIDLSAYPAGGYKIRVEKLNIREVPFLLAPELHVREYWAAFPVFKTAE